MTKNMTGNEKKQAFVLQPVMVQNGKKNKITVFLTDMSFVWMYLAGLLVWMIVALPMPVSVSSCVLLAGAAAVLQQAVFSISGKKKWWCLLIWCVVLIVTAVTTYEVWISGMHLICNDVLDAWGRQFPYLYNPYKVMVEENLQMTAYYEAIAWLLLLLAPAGGYLVRSGNRILLALQMILLLMFQAVCGLEVGITAFCVSVFCFLAVWMRGHGERVAQGVQRLAVIEQLIAVVVLALLTLGGTSMLTERFVSEDGTIVSVWKKDLEERIEDLRYQGDAENLPNGDFRELSSFEKDGKPVLEITMSQPDSYYLRGFTGSTYTGDGWTEAEEEALWENRDLFYWLHQDNFFGQEILSDAALALSSVEDLPKENIVTVKNIGGNSKYLYTPYELNSMQDDALWSVLDQQKIGDCSVYAEGWTGNREYTYQALENQVVNYPTYAAALLEQENLSTSGKNYQKNEEYYNAFVYDTYLELPERLQREFSSVLGVVEQNSEEKHADYTEAKQNILYCLTSEYQDSEKLDEAWDGTDFVYEFLEVSKKGYSVHFASAAALMFRYYGIPARYVEGYLVTPDDVKAMTAGESYVLDDTHAHAWAEYYQDGVGWLPFETTPSYLNTMNRADEFQDISGVSGGSSQDQQQEEEEEEEEQEEEEEETIDWLQILIIVLLVGVILLLLTMVAFLVWIFLQRRKSKKLKRRFASEDLREAICSMYEYTMNILSAAGMRIGNTSLYRYEKQIKNMFDEETAMEYRRVVDIRQEAVYSQNPLSQEQKEEMMEFKEKVWKRIYTNGTWIQKMQLKYIYFL